eukprot:scaffold4498_cov119-Isochrysis_galbana.AAC.27
MGVSLRSPTDPATPSPSTHIWESCHVMMLARSHMRISCTSVNVSAFASRFSFLAAPSSMQHGRRLSVPRVDTVWGQSIRRFAELCLVQLAKYRHAQARASARGPHEPTSKYNIQYTIKKWNLYSAHPKRRDASLFRRTRA